MHQVNISPVMLERGRFNRDGRDQSFTDLDMSRTAHVVVDMQKAFLVEGSCAEIPNAREIVGNVNAISRAVRDGGGLNVFLRITYDTAEEVPWTSWYSSLLGRPFSTDLTAALTPGNPLHELAPQIEVAPGEPVVNKTRFSGFTPGTSTLDAVLKKHGIDTVIITGTLTNCCSEATARDAHQLNYKVIFVSDANATVTDEEHNATLGNLYVVYADVVPTSQVLDLVAAASHRAAAQ